MKSITTIERMVIESIYSAKRSIFEISQDTDLSLGIIKNTTQELLKEKIISQKQGSFFIENVQLEKLNIKKEVKDIGSSMIKQYFSDRGNKQSKSGLIVQKIWMNTHQEKIFKALVGNVEEYLKNLKNDQKSKPQGKLSKKQVVMIGFTEYGSLSNQILGTPALSM
ncbi:MAG: hypothetical protein HOE90_00730 [Bacteriovoracaceae bacterium]|nr:hypothetical protein [Bacteriovoracaceae bacterium]